MAKFDYFVTLESQSDYAVREAEMLMELFNDYDQSKLDSWMTRLHELEQAGDEQIHQIYTHLATEFITPIDREDILQMGQRLDDIVDYVEDVVLQMYMYNVQEIWSDALPFCQLMLDTTRALKNSLSEFKNFKKAGQALHEYVVIVNDLEEEADTLYTQTIAKLYRNYAEDPLFVLTWSNLFNRMERVIDTCENVSDMIGTIILKNS